MSEEKLPRYVARTTSINEVKEPKAPEKPPEPPKEPPKAVVKPPKATPKPPKMTVKPRKHTKPRKYKGVKRLSELKPLKTEKTELKGSNNAKIAAGIVLLTALIALAYVLIKVMDKLKESKDVTDEEINENDEVNEGKPELLEVNEQNE